jgi:zinc transporter ZupT
VTGALAFSALAAVVIILGGMLVLARTPRERTTLDALTAFGGGFMLAVALFDMLPHALDVDAGFTIVTLGYLAVHVTQHVLPPHFHFGEETHAEAMVSRGIGFWALAGLLPHSFFDGVAIASGFLVGPELGVLIFLAVLLHNAPTGIALASIMVASGNTRRQAMLALATIGIATVAGALVTPTIEALVRYGLALAAGVTLYVAASNLIPESQNASRRIVPISVILGVLAFLVVRFLLPDA